MNCKICGREMVLEVLQNHSGWYLGYVCDTCGPQTRESGYFATLEAAEVVLGKYLDEYEEPENIRTTGYKGVKE